MRQRGKMTPLRAGLVSLVVIVAVVFFAFAKDIPFTQPYQFNAVFDNSAVLLKGSPVRIAGVDVGKVAEIKPVGGDSTASEVTISMQERGLPIRRDARLKIRPRIFLEGNFFVDLRPGTPGSPDLPDGGTIGPAQTSAPVQIDQVLATLKADARKDLQDLLDGYGDALAGKPKPGEDDDQDPDTRGQTAAESLNDSLQDAPASLRDSSIVADALRGSEPGDLPRLIRGLQRTTGALADREGNLKDLITNLNTTTGALAAEQDNLRATLRELPRVLRAANPALDSLNASFPATRAFAREILPGVRETPASIEVALPWIAQMRPLVSNRELGGAVGDLQPAIRDMARFTDGTVRLLPQADRLNRCFTKNLLPTGDTVLRDGPLTTGVSVQDEFFQALVGLSGESQNFDGNGSYTRLQAGGGNTVSTGSVAGGQKWFANAARPPLGTKPARPSRTPPFNTTALCLEQKRPNLNGARTGGGP